ncbi:MAG: hypothetical protein ACK5TE_14920 [Pseudomonadota bacterium]
MSDLAAAVPHRRTRLGVALAGALAAATLVLPPLGARAQSSTPPAPATASVPQGAEGARREAYRSLMSPEERAAFREKMQAASPQEREGLARAQRQELERRAAERGLAPPSPGAHAHGPRGHHGAQGAGEAPREARREAYQSLTTPEERTAFREKMRAAAPEERRALAQAHRSDIEQRARDRGIALPPAPAGHRHHDRPHGPRGPKATPPATPAG